MKTLILLALISQFPGQPSKDLPQATLPRKSTPLASPQADPVQASPQVGYQAAPVQQTVVLRAVPSVYAVTRQVIVQAAPVTYAAVLADPVVYAASDPCVAQQQVVQRNVVLRQNVIQHSAVVNHSLGAGIVHQAQVNHAIGGGAGRPFRKVVTRQVTKQKRGLLGGLFGG